MKERPILFSAPMVRAILEGRKTQTRRVVKPQPHEMFDFQKPGDWWPHGGYAHRIGSREMREMCPHGAAGDRLWVRETWAWPGEEEVLYRATDQHLQDRMKEHPLNPQFVWRPSIFMRRQHSRISLEITGVRVERLHEMSAEDALAEGIEERSGLDVPGYSWPGTPQDFSDPRDAFERGWNELQTARANKWWRQGTGTLASPWVWVIEFRRVEADLRRGVA